MGRPKNMNAGHEAYKKYVKALRAYEKQKKAHEKLMEEACIINDRCKESNEERAKRLVEMNAASDEMFMQARLDAKMGAGMDE